MLIASFVPRPPRVLWGAEAVDVKAGELGVRLAYVLKDCSLIHRWGRLCYWVYTGVEPFLVHMHIHVLSHAGLDLHTSRILIINL